MPLVKAFFHNLPAEQCLHSAPHGQVNKKSKPHPQTLTIGSPTSGADGDIVRIPLPGGLMTCFSGIGVFYPDGTPTQAVGVRLDVEVNDTVESLQAGRDLVLEKALELASGD